MSSEQTSVPSSVPTLVLSSVQSTNNIDNTDNIDNKENKEIYNNILNNNILGFSLSVDGSKVFEGSKVEVNESERSVSEPSTYSKEPSISPEALCISEDEGAAAALSDADLVAILQEAEAERDSILSSKEFDNYTDAVNDILDQYGDEVFSQIQCLLNDEDDWMRLRAEQRLLGIINAGEGDRQKTVRNLIEYSFRRKESERVAAEEQEARRNSNDDLFAAINLGDDFDVCDNPYSDFIFEQEKRMRQNLNG